MDIKELKALIADLPDDTQVIIDLDLQSGHPANGCTTTDVTAEMWNKMFYITAKFDKI